MHQVIIYMLPSLVMGIIARIYMIRIDQRQYPSYPQGFISHITLGIIAAFLGSLAIPALIEKEYGAITFLALAAQQFRDVRSMERASLDNIEPTELVQRGTAYVEDIAKAFEARNYMVILTSLATSIGTYFIKIFYGNIYVQVTAGIIIGTITMVVLKYMLIRESIQEIGEVKIAKVYFKGALLYVNDVVMTNIGMQEIKDYYINNALAVEIKPRDRNSIEMLANMGQRQAILHNIYVQLGIKKDSDEIEYTPQTKRNSQTGTLIVLALPLIKDEKLFVKSVEGTAIIETAKRTTLEKNIAKKIT